MKSRSVSGTFFGNYPSIKDKQARFLIEKETENRRSPTKEEKLWPHLYPWNCWDEDCEIFHMLLNRNQKGLEKEFIGNIRSLRRQYEFDMVTLSSYNLALWKLARRRGIELNLPPVSEMPLALLEDRPLDAEKWKLPGQAVLDRALEFLSGRLGVRVTSPTLKGIGSNEFWRNISYEK